jgi:hypothetical protein
VGGFTEGQLEEMGYKGGEGDEDFRYASIPNLFMRRIQRTVSRVSTQVGVAACRTARKKRSERRAGALWMLLALRTTSAPHHICRCHACMFRCAPSSRSLR